ncbi:hypothetical protein PD280_16995 [Virgibacillus salarius]|uniref:hypothetical protein n=1 Tax=Virgibacillus salarius TaxID=447199 RepID=UPI00041C784C|nr:MULTISPECIES: hypothetical protein [Bacillaceae]WBX79398.1 hypothetical protein PD280_16995 [Virgibacillus salarius]
MVRGEDSAERQLQTLEVVAKQRTVETNGTEADTRSYSEQFYEWSKGIVLG